MIRVCRDSLGLRALAAPPEHESLVLNNHWSGMEKLTLLWLQPRGPDTLFWPLEHCNMRSAHARMYTLNKTKSLKNDRLSCLTFTLFDSMR